MNATIKDVAKTAGVSPMTVSRVLNDGRYVRESTRKKIWEVVEKLNYTPSEEGRRLASSRSQGKRRTGNIGCILFPTYAKYTEPFFAEILEEVDRALNELKLHHYFTLTLNELEDPVLFARQINPQVVDGCLLLGVGDLYRKEILRIRQKMPHLVILSDYLEKDRDISCVYADVFQAGYLAANYLIGLGHRRIACITGHFDWPEYSRLKFLGYKKALADAGIACDETLVKEGKYSIEGAIRAANALLEGQSRPTAIFVVSDPMAIGVYKALQQRGLAIPRDVSVVGCDNISISPHMYPSLTTVTEDKRETARMAVRILVDEIEERRGAGTRTVFPMRLVERESCFITG
ncbi:MAG: LacI family DNA-binding transcriptional regulator [Verrucomicrobiae bacterium]|nr:LacI family DNA-binding transcriptional regulator [Verrucomicrobiae bacterium]